MSSNDAIQRMVQCGVIPVVVLPDAASAVPLAEALLSGGIDVIEITLRNEAGLAGLEQVARHVPQMLAVAGTVITAAQMSQVADAGAACVVSPGFTQQVDAAAKSLAMPWLPGVSTASDCMQALSAGRQMVKFFPAEQAGGPAMIKALGGPYPGLSFCPTGGVTLANMSHYFSLESVKLVGGSWIAPLELVKTQQWSTITELAKQARVVVETLRQSR